MPLIDSISTHSFIYYKLSKVLNCIIYLALEFQIMIANGGTINCLRKCHNINIIMGEYVLNIPMISILIYVIDGVLGVQWLQSLRT